MDKYPYINGQDHRLRSICSDKMKELYPSASAADRERLEWELKAIEKNGTAFVFLIMKEIFEDMGVSAYEIGNRGCLCNSLVAYLCGLTEIDPIKYRLSPYFFYGIDGEKKIDVNFNLAPEVREEVIRRLQEHPSIGALVASETGNSMFFLLPEGYDRSFFEIPLDDEHIRELYPEFFYFYLIEHAPQALLKQLHEKTQVHPVQIRTTDEEVLDFLRKGTYEVPSIASGDGSTITVDTCDIPEFKSDFVRTIIEATNPTDFFEMSKVLGLLHGTSSREYCLDEWTDLDHIPTTRDDIFDVLKDGGFRDDIAYQIAEAVRRGRVAGDKCTEWPVWRAMMIEQGIPELLADECERIRYLFPRAHCMTYLLESWRLAWYKLHFPEIAAEVFH